MDKTELKRLSKKYLGSESRYVKLMEKGIAIPKIGTRKDELNDGKPAHFRELSKGIPLFETKRYTQGEIEAMFSDFEQKEADKKEKERLEELAKTVRTATGISNQ